MNPKRLLLAIVVIFPLVWVTDFLIHGVWLASAYRETAELWRPENEMKARMGWLILGQFLWTATFVVVWAQGFAAKGCLRCAALYGLCMGLFFETNTLIAYAVQPIPPLIATEWFVVDVARAVLMGLVLAGVYQPRRVAGSAPVDLPPVKA